MKQKPTIKVIHQLPHRVRIKLSQPITNKPFFCQIIKEKTKNTEIRYNHLIQTVLINFDPSEIRLQEIIYRVCTAFSLENGMVPIKLVEETTANPINRLSIYAGGMIMFSSIYAFLNRKSLTFNFVDTNIAKATLGVTGLSILEHAYLDTKRKGIFDPELLSVVYLLKNYIDSPKLSSLVLMWLTTFGRHLVVNYREVKDVNLLKVKSVDSQKTYYIANIKNSKEITNLSEAIYQFINHSKLKNQKEEKYILTI